MPRLTYCAALGALLLASGCSLQLTSFVVPAQAWSGSIFELRVSATIASSSGSAGTASCVLQLPNGFDIVGLTCTATEGAGRDSTLAARYVAEPGTHIEGITGSAGQNSSASSPTLQVFVRTTPGLAGSFQIKVALGGIDSGIYTAQDPRVTQFALITDAAHSKTISITPAPIGDFVFDSEGLPIDSVPRSRIFSGAACGDLDGDGMADVVVAHPTSGLRDFRSMPHTSGHEPGTQWVEQPLLTSTLTAVNARPAIADLDRDGQADVVIDSRVVFGHGVLWIESPQLPVLQQGSDCAAIADVNHDGWPDIALGGHTSRTLQVLLNNGDRTFRDSSLGLPNVANSATGRDTVLLADLDGDGNLDLFWSTTVASFAFRGDGQGNWIPQTLPAFQTVGDAVAIDIDGNGTLEIVNGRGTVLSYAGNNSFALVAGAGLTGIQAVCIEALDFDRDGDLDLAVTAPEIQIWVNDGLGHFTRSQTTGLPSAFVGSIVDLQVGDIDGNSWPDLVATVDGTGVFAFQNLRTGVAPFGQGCGGAGVQAPTLQAIGSPLRGNAAFALQLHSSTGSVLGGIWFDGDRTHLGAAPLPLDLGQLGAPGCELLVPPTFLGLGQINAAGDLTISLSVPPTPALARLTVFAQGCACVPTANAAGSVLSAGLTVRIN